MNCTLKSGLEYVICRLPEGWQVTTFDARNPEPLDMGATLHKALEGPVGAPPLGDWLRPLQRIVAIVPDVTRYNASERFLPILYENYLKGKALSVLYALGNHRKQSVEEQRGIVSDTIFDRVPCVDHDCYDRERLVSLGNTSSGLEVVVNRALTEADGLIVTGSISFHYLAGFGGGRKAIFPGVAGYESIIGIHRAVFHREQRGKHPKARSAVLDGNPMHEEIMEAIALIKTPMFLINTVLDEKKNLLNIFAGDMREAHRKGCDWYRDRFAVAAEEKADVVIVSSGGYPKDINFIQAHKAIEHGLAGVRQGGTLIVVGKCQDGLGHDDFLRWFDYGDSASMEQQARTTDKVYAQTAYATRLKGEYCNIVFVSDLDEDVVKRMGLIPKKSLAEAIAFANAKPVRLCYIVPNASQTLLL